MNKRPRPCIVCGRRVDDGSTRCPAHAVGSSRMRSCLVCGRSSQGNYCQLHEPKVDEAERNARNPYRRAYKDVEYARNRQIRFERAHGRCEWPGCGIELQIGEWECDHLQELEDGGTNAVENLRVLCKPHHRVKTAEHRRNKRRDTPR